MCDFIKILVVDDHEDGLTILSMLLASMGHEIRSCNGSHECLQVAKEFEPHVILLDLGMHGLNGFDLAPKFRELAFPFTLAALTGHTELEYRTRCENMGFDYFLPKPASGDSIRALIESVERRCATA